MRQPHPPPKKLASPEPTILRHNPSADEFALWCQNPVTQWVAKAFQIGAQANEEAWMRLLKERVTDSNALLLTKLEYQIRADAYAAFLETNHADYLKMNDPKEHKQQYG